MTLRIAAASGSRKNVFSSKVENSRRTEIGSTFSQAFRRCFCSGADAAQGAAVALDDLGLGRVFGLRLGECGHRDPAYGVRDPAAAAA